MSRLVDADALLDKAWDAENGFGWEKVISIKDVMDAPVINLIQCCDCEFWYLEEDYGYGYCLKHDFIVPRNWYCADRKGKKDEID